MLILLRQRGFDAWRDVLDQFDDYFDSLLFNQDTKCHEEDLYIERRTRQRTLQKSRYYIIIKIIVHVRTYIQ